MKQKTLNEALAIIGTYQVLKESGYITDYRVKAYTANFTVSKQGLQEDTFVKISIRRKTGRKKIEFQII